jgi:hypothetical protein
MTTPAGWYDDPHDVRYIRYWDGFQWGADVAPKVAGPIGAAGSQGIDTGPSSVLHYIVPVGRSWQSVLAPYLGLFSLISLPVVGQLFGVGAIVVGVLALKRARTGGHGTGRAITGIVLGAIGTATSTVFLVMVIAANGHTS